MVTTDGSIGEIPRSNYVKAEEKVIKEQGLAVSIKDGSNGNIFECKLVRYNTYVKQ